MKKIGVLVIVFSMLFTITIAPIFAANETIDASRTTSSTSTFYSGSDGTVALIVSAASLYPYISASSYDSYSHRDIITVNQEYLYMIRMYNTTDNYYVFNRGLVGVNISRIEYPSDIHNGGYIGQITNTGYSVKDIYGSLLDSFSVNTAGLLWGYVSADFQYNNMICLPPHSSVYSFFSVVDTTSIDCTFADNNFISTYFPKLDRYVNTVSISYPESASVNNNAYIQNADVNSYYSMEYIESSYNELINIKSKLNSIDSNVQIITDAYTNNQQNTTNTQSNISTVNSNESTLHQAEQNFYQQNEQALNNVGLSNFSFNSDQSSGLGSVITDFTTLWNNIGPLQIIFTFTLSMSLATFLLRHKPVTGAIKKNEKR